MMIGRMGERVGQREGLMDGEEGEEEEEEKEEKEEKEKEEEVVVVGVGVWL